MFKRFLNKKRMSRGIEIEDSILSDLIGLDSNQERKTLEVPIEKKGLNIFWYVLMLGFLGLILRIFYLDIVKGEYYAEISRGNRIRSLVIKAPRGKIFDKTGNVLASNVSSVDVILIPGDLPKEPEKKQQIAGALAEILEINSDKLKEVMRDLNSKSLNPILVKENITQDQSLIILEKRKNLPGILLENTAIRNYENGPIFSHLIGYEGKITREELENNPDYLMTDYIGKTGIEKEYEKELKGVYGLFQVEVDALGDIKKNLGIINPQPGNDLVLNIDEGLQKKIYDSLVNILEKTETKMAAAVAINPQNGEVLSLVSLPGYDNNFFARGISVADFQEIIADKNLPLFNRVVAGEYPPGSILKPAVAVAALAEGIVAPETSVECRGEISVGNFKFRDWKAHGTTDLKKAIAESCDVYFYHLGGGYGSISGLGMSKMKKYENLFGLGDFSGIDLPGETRGLIPDENWKMEKIGEKWYTGDSYHAAIGQGFITTTPIQLVNYTAALANGGTLFSPKIIHSIRQANGEEKFIVPEVLRKNIAPDWIMQTVRDGMRQTITEGTGRLLNDLPFSSAGKTGTAQFGNENKTHAWFISFAPFENPEIAMVVFLEGGGEGNSSSVPATKEILKWYFARKNAD
ncbi:MAG: penicillin-binding protein 2 [Candidatus Moranbacteria bacterium CG06_land_8_20_14_3_00_40_12]|nr:MAG: penicillin-binding protein 2 [Candidatus Moranbacteria bacterium CG23_combo_of_CG06-09_8_20_14_all_40_16]PIU80305.1 MAG: penicillin-binding protein 2 [Candidatus Moranbacteria bacterium CG06_land_8_20_14_3_00_40_12]